MAGWWRDGDWESGVNQTDFQYMALDLVYAFNERLEQVYLDPVHIDFGENLGIPLIKPVYSSEYSGIPLTKLCSEVLTGLVNNWHHLFRSRSHLVGPGETHIGYVSSQSLSLGECVNRFWVPEEVMDYTSLTSLRTSCYTPHSLYIRPSFNPDIEENPSIDLDLYHIINNMKATYLGHPLSHVIHYFNIFKEIFCKMRYLLVWPFFEAFYNVPPPLPPVGLKFEKDASADPIYIDWNGDPWTYPYGSIRHNRVVWDPYFNPYCPDENTTIVDYWTQPWGTNKTGKCTIAFSTPYFADMQPPVGQDFGYILPDTIYSRSNPPPGELVVKHLYYDLTGKYFNGWDHPSLSLITEEASGDLAFTTNYGKFYLKDYFKSSEINTNTITVFKSTSSTENYNIWLTGSPNSYCGRFWASTDDLVEVSRGSVSIELKNLSREYYDLSNLFKYY